MTPEQLSRTVDRATKRTQQFFQSELKKDLKAVKQLLKDHAADAQAAGNPDAARRIRTLSRDVVAAIRV